MSAALPHYALTRDSLPPGWFTLDGWASDGTAAPVWVGAAPPQAAVASDGEAGPALARARSEQSSRNGQESTAARSTDPGMLWQVKGVEVLHTVRDVRSLCVEGIVGVRERLESGLEEALWRIASVSLEDALLVVDDLDAPELAARWSDACDGRRCPGKVWREFMRLYNLDPGDVTGAWVTAWASDARALLAACKFCGTRTLELRWDDGRTRFLRDRCRSTRCAHCSSRIVGHAWRERARKQAAHDVEHRRGWAWGTVSMDPGAWCAERGLPVTRDTAILAQRWMAQQFGVWMRELRTRWRDLDYWRALELHESDWPHVHLVLRGSIVDELLEEARKRGRGETWEAVGRWSAHQYGMQRAGRQKRAVCPFPTMRKMLNQWAVATGFGISFEIRPVTMDDVDNLVDYLCKGPQSYGKAKRIREPVEELAGELTKNRQRRGKPLARGVRAWDASRARKDGKGFFDAAPRRVRIERPEREAGDDSTPVLTDVRRVNLCIDEVREMLGTLGGGDVIAPDFSGDVPDEGGKRPRVLEQFVGETSAVESLQQLAELEREARGDALDMRDLVRDTGPPAAAATTDTGPARDVDRTDTGPPPPATWRTPVR